MNIIDPKFDKRWEDGIEHHPKSIELMEHIKEVDFNQGGDSFDWKTGGDGDNGETLMYEMDSFFELESEGEEKVFFDVQGVEHCNDEKALAILLQMGVLFCNCGDGVVDSEGVLKYNTTLIYVLCNDIFAWGCADAEDLPHAEIANIYRMVIADPSWGSTRWCCIKRNQKPQEPVADMMKRAESWDDVMEDLPVNEYDKYLDEKHQEELINEKKA